MSYHWGPYKICGTMSLWYGTIGTVLYTLLLQRLSFFFGPVCWDLGSFCMQAIFRRGAFAVFGDGGLCANPVLCGKF